MLQNESNVLLIINCYNIIVVFVDYIFSSPDGSLFYKHVPGYDPNRILLNNCRKYSLVKNKLIAIMYINFHIRT
jgi:hypothetical protein